MTEVEDSVGPRWDAAERRAEPRIRTLLRIAKITSVNDSGLCCLRSISDSGLMAETNLVLMLGEQLQFELSDRHRLCGRVVWRDEAGRSEEHTSVLQSLMRISSVVFCVNIKITCNVSSH